MATEMFGFQQNALYCPTRVPASRSIQRSRGALHWILVAAEEHVSKRRNNGLIPLNPSILHRRAVGYGVLRSLLSTSNFDLDDTVTALRYATVAECYANKPDAATEHVGAFDTILQQPGAIEYFVLNMERTALSLSSLKNVYICAPCKIKTLGEFEAARIMVFMSLRQLQSLAKKPYAGKCGCATSPPDNGPIADDVDQSSSPDLVDRFIKTKKSTLLSAQASMAIGKNFDPSWKFPFQAGLFSLLYVLNMTLGSFGIWHLREKIKFLEELRSVIDGSSLSPLGPSSLLAMVDWVREQFYRGCFSKDEAVSRELRLCSNAINALKLFALLDLGNRILITETLRTWILSDISQGIDIEGKYFGASLLVSMEKQATISWWNEGTSTPTYQTS